MVKLSTFKFKWNLYLIIYTPKIFIFTYTSSYRVLHGLEIASVFSASVTWTIFNNFFLFPKGTRNKHFYVNQTLKKVLYFPDNQDVVGNLVVEDTLAVVHKLEEHIQCAAGDGLLTLSTSIFIDRYIRKTVDKIWKCKLNLFII